MNNANVSTNTGVTNSERYLGRLCRRSFLSLWSYQGIYRDQDNGKEICDLLVIFGDHILIFSDKNCEFPDTGDLQTDWNRWVKKAVLESGKQIRGAERWIKQFPDRIFIDPACTKKLPLNLPSPNKMKIHRILVAHGAGERCQLELGGSGSLMVDTTIVSKDHYKSFEDGGMPFTVGLIDSKLGYIHVLDDTTLDIVIENLDTISDFVSYLEKKELLVAQKPVMATGEENLLAIYLGNLNENGEHDFVSHSGYDLVHYGEGSWDYFLVSPEKRARDLANEISYSWDRLIERFSHHIIRNSQHYTSHPYDINSNERIIRFMAAERRTRRRMLVRKLIQMVTDTVHLKRSSVAVPFDKREPYYVFLILPLNENVSKEIYRDVRYKLLVAYCRVVKVKFPQAQDIIGIATEAGVNDLSSEDAIYLDARNWNNEDQLEALALQKEFGILQDTNYYHVHEDEYPHYPRYGRDTNNSAKKVSRNAPCPCGSGKKYKNCCLRKSQV